MDIRITKTALEELGKISADKLRIFVQGYGWSGPYYGLAQDEPQDGDFMMEKDGISFAVEQELADVINFFEIDYAKGWLRKGFAVYANGSRGSC